MSMTLLMSTRNTTVVTPQYLGQFGVKHFLAKDKDDTAHGTITFEKVQNFLQIYVDLVMTVKILPLVSRMFMASPFMSWMKTATLSTMILVIRLRFLRPMRVVLRLLSLAMS